MRKSMVIALLVITASLLALGCGGEGNDSSEPDPILGLWCQSAFPYWSVNVVNHGKLVATLMWAVSNNVYEFYIYPKGYHRYVSTRGRVDACFRLNQDGSRLRMTWSVGSLPMGTVVFQKWF